MVPGITMILRSVHWYLRAQAEKIITVLILLLTLILNHQLLHLYEHIKRSRDTSHFVLCDPRIRMPLNSKE